MGKNKIEDIIKNRLLGHRVHIDTDELLTSMGILHKEPKKRRYIYWLVPGIVGLFALIFFLTDFSANSNKSLAISELGTIQQNTNVSKEIFQLEGELFDKSPVDIKSKNVKYNNITNVKSALSNVMDSRIGENLNLSNSSLKQTYGLPLNQHIQKVQDTDATSSNQILNHQTSSMVEDESNKSINEKTSTHRIHDVVLLKDTITLIRYQVNYPITVVLFDSNEQRRESLSYESKYWSVIPSLGVSKFNRSLEPKDIKSANYLLLRKEEEMELEQIEVGLAFKYKFTDFSYVKFGLELNSFNSKLTDVKYKAYSNGDSVLVKDLVINLQGDTSYTNRMVLVDGYTKEKRTYYNNLLLANIPIAFGIEKTKGKWSYSAEAIFSTNVYSKFMGSLKNPKDRLVENPDYYNSRLNFIVGSSVAIGYSITPKSNLFLNVSYKSSFGSFTNRNYEISEKYSSYGLSLGYDYILNYCE